MSDFIIVVACLSEYVAYPAKERYLRIGIVSTDTEDDRMDEDECIEKICEWELPIRHEDDDESDEGRKDLKSPREIIMR